MRKEIDTRKWTPSERLNKTLFVTMVQDPSTEKYHPDKDFVDVLAIAKRCHDVRLVFKTLNGETAIYYLSAITVDAETGDESMTFVGGHHGAALYWDKNNNVYE